MPDIFANPRIVLCGALLICAGAWSTVHADEAAPRSAPEVRTATNLEVAEAMDHLEPLWESMQSDVVSSDVTFRVFYVNPIIPMTPEEVRVVFEKCSLGEQPQQVADFLHAVAGPDVNVKAPVRRLWTQGQFVRHELGLHVHVHDDRYSFISDGDNEQVQVFELGRCWNGTPGLELFRTPSPSRSNGFEPDKAERFGSTVRLFDSSRPEGFPGELRTIDTIDWATGVPLRRESLLDSVVLQASDFSGLSTFASGIVFPRCVLTVRCKKGIVDSMELAFLDEARFNEAIPESTFVVSKPMKWNVLDFRGQAGVVQLPAPKAMVADVRDLLPDPVVALSDGPLPRDTRQASLSPPKRILLVLNGLALITLGIWMWKRASLKEPKH